MTAGSTNTRRRHWIHAAAFILMEVAALAMVGYDSEIQRSWMGRLSHTVTAFVWGGVENVRRYFHLREENALLAEQNQYLMRVLSLEGRRTQDTLSLPAGRQRKGGDNWTGLPAQIVKHQFKGDHSYYLLDKGAEDGVQADCGVVTPRGVVGVVEAVSPHYSYVRSFFSVGMTVSVREDSTGVTGPMVWDGKGRSGARIRSIPHHILIPPGREIRTSSYSALFPPDIPVGVTGQTRISPDGTQDIELNLYEDPARLRYVVIVSRTWRDEIRQLEQ